jgi:hypothetical protein
MRRFDFHRWACDVVEAKAAIRSSWCRHWQPVLACALAQANHCRPVDVAWVDAIADELACCRREIHIEERRTN